MKRCAIYTRKSSDEGLDQQFNSLDAQREACEAYVLSQVGDGWSALPARYDDGGYSGGSMDRPALKALLDDIRRGRIDVVVVYKIDRLTRSLADFARIVEQFDAREVSFVSVTQAFNTTSSMGRLTLNVLLSFAQFEREVTGERIRDKIAASKAKGMWMGGLSPLGYDPPPTSERILQVNEGEAETVRLIFARYLELKSVHALVAELAERGIVSKLRIRRDGTTCGGQPLTRGALFHILRNRVYRGEIVHKGEAHPGLHEPIVTAELFDVVQTMLGRNAKTRRRRTAGTAPLASRLFLADGTRMTPTHSRGSGGRLYRYYVPLAQQTGKHCQGSSMRLAAFALETRIRSLLAAIGRVANDPLDLVAKVILHGNRIDLHLPATCRLSIAQVMTTDQALHDINELIICWSLPYTWPNKNVEIERVAHAVRRDRVLIEALRTAHAMLDYDRRGNPILREVPEPRYLRRLARLAFLSPKLQAAILTGLQPPTLTLEKIVRGKVPLLWEEQDHWALRRG